MKCGAVELSLVLSGAIFSVFFSGADFFLVVFLCRVPLQLPSEIIYSRVKKVEKTL